MSEPCNIGRKRAPMRFVSKFSAKRLCTGRAVLPNASWIMGAHLPPGVVLQAAVQRDGSAAKSSSRRSV